MSRWPMHLDLMAIMDRMHTDLGMHLGTQATKRPDGTPSSLNPSRPQDDTDTPLPVATTDNAAEEDAQNLLDFELLQLSCQKVLDEDWFGDCKLDANSERFADLAAALHRAGLDRFWGQVLAWCSEVGAKSVEDVEKRFDEFARVLRLNPFEKCALRRRLVLPVPTIEDMTLGDVAAELAVDAAQFRKNCAMMYRIAFATVQDVVNYLQVHGVLLSAAQAKQVFGIVFPKVSSRPGSQYSIRSQLVMALHCFCVEPYVFWEDDGDRQCMWTHMTYNDDEEIWESGLCQELDGSTAGEKGTWGRVQEESCKGGCGFWPGPDGYCSLCSAGKGPKYPGGKRPESVEEARLVLRRDVNGLREALKAYRHGRDRHRAIEKIVRPKFYGEPGDSL